MMLLMLLSGCTPGQRCRTPCQVELPHPEHADQSWATLTLEGGRLVHEQTSWAAAVAVFHEDGREADRIANEIRLQELEPALAPAWVLHLDDDGTVREYGARPDAIQALSLTP